MYAKLTVGAFLVCGLALSGVTSAAVIANPALATGPDAIDPAGGRNDLNLVVPGAATKPDVLAVPDFGVYGNQQTWFGVDFSVGVAPNATAVNYYTFNDRPDFRTTFVGEPNRNSGSGTGGAAAYTSGPASPLGGESLFFGTSNQNTWTVDFGTYIETDATFAADQGVGAVGFAFMRNSLAAVPTVWKATFYDGDTILSAQTVEAGTAQNVAALFAYIAGPDEQITRVVVGSPTGTQYDNKNHFIDDFGFAPLIPEPATLGAIALTGLALLRRP